MVWKHYRAQGRHALPWRMTRDPYRVLVSEIMLQQTQVERVLAYYEAWMKQFPTAKALAKAPFATVLRAWQGLGYNRRAKHLHAAVKEALSRGLFRTQNTPRSNLGKTNLVEEWEALPGVGPYTARAIAAFAYNQNVVFIETNIRTAVIHHFFEQGGTLLKKKGRNINGKNTTIYRSISDKELLMVVAETLPKGRAREWYGALMDYGAYLKRNGVRLNARTKGYKKQSSFAGSRREARGAILKALVGGPRESAFLVELMGPSRRAQTREALASLTQEGMVQLRDGQFSLPLP